MDTPSRRSSRKRKPSLDADMYPASGSQAKAAKTAKLATPRASPKAKTPAKTKVAVTSTPKAAPSAPSARKRGREDPAPVRAARTPTPRKGGRVKTAKVRLGEEVSSEEEDTDLHFEADEPVLVWGDQAKTKLYEAVVLKSARQKKGQLLHFVHFQGWPRRHDSWMPRDMVICATPAARKKYKHVLET
jgi:hypothetical protein